MRETYRKTDGQQTYREIETQRKIEKRESASVREKDIFKERKLKHKSARKF